MNRSLAGWYKYGIIRHHQYGHFLGHDPANGSVGIAGQWCPLKGYRSVYAAGL